MARKLPVGIQSFAVLREDEYLYVDKTEYIYTLAHTGMQYFLSRPRRFGKSLLLSTMRAYFEGRRKLFEGLKIEKLEDGKPHAWEPYPVFYFDFNGRNYLLPNTLEELIRENLEDWEAIFGTQYSTRSPQGRFEKLLTMAHAQTGKRCVVLIDEYDKPLLDVIENQELVDHNRAVMKGFFSTLKKMDEHLQFVFVTGVTKFHKVSIFSDLNQLNDISLNEDYAAICGITEKELRENFKEEIAALARRRNLTEEDVLAALKKNYDGYHFSPRGEGVYNPFSLLRAFYQKAFGAYWFETGTPTYLVKRIRRSGFDVRKFTDRTLYATESMLSSYMDDNLDLVPLLYQSGYLTIVGCDDTESEFTLAFPNEEVKYGFTECLLPTYVSDKSGTGTDILTLRQYVETGNPDGIRDVLTALFASIPYTVENDPFEHYFQTVIYLVFTLLGKSAVCEMHTFTGRIDCKVETKKYIYLFEFKRDENADAALVQIASKEYALPFVADSRKLFKIGVNFDSKTRKLTDWKVAE